MKYINALELINIALENNILTERDGGILVYREASHTNCEGWYLTEKDILAKELMSSEEGQKVIISALKKKNVEYTPKEYSYTSDTSSILK